jgi:hypothetical protein
VALQVNAASLISANGKYRWGITLRSTGRCAIEPRSAGDLHVRPHKCAIAPAPFVSTTAASPRLRHIWECELTRPSRIYKYEPMSIQALTNLKSESIYFNSPLNFNDPFDCNMALEVSVPYMDEIPFIKAFLLEETKGTDGAAKIEEMSENEIAAMGMVMARNYMNDRKAWAFNSYGICCFSETNDNLLMWSHYASSGKGFCLEFDSSREPFDKVRRVKYTNNPSKLNFRKLFSVDKLYLLDALFCAKSTHWKYEKEWRIFQEHSSRAEKYPTSSLTGIYFGPEIDDVHAEIVRQILQGQNSHIKIYKGARSREAYKVVFSEVSLGSCGVEA